MTALPMLLRCARHQLAEDAALWEHLGDQRHIEIGVIQPNLLIRTGTAPCSDVCPPDCDAHHGYLLPMLMVKAP